MKKIKKFDSRKEAVEYCGRHPNGHVIYFDLKLKKWIVKKYRRK